MRLPDSAHTSAPGGSTRSPQIAAPAGDGWTVTEVDQLIDDCLDPEALGKRHIATSSIWLRTLERSF